MGMVDLEGARCHDVNKSDMPKYGGGTMEEGLEAPTDECRRSFRFFGKHEYGKNVQTFLENAAMIGASAGP